MSALLRQAVLRSARQNAVKNASTHSRAVSSGSSIPVAAFRRLNIRYASHKAAKSTSTLVPGSQQPITDPVAREEYAKAEGKMKAAVEWFRKDCADSETRASGRVTPAILSPVRVTYPGSSEKFKLDEVATIGVREGSILLVTLFDEEVSLLISYRRNETD